MNLKSLLLCSDDKIVRVLRRTLGDLDIGVELCASSEIALRKLTRERFEAIIVDCAGPGAAAVLRSLAGGGGHLIDLSLAGAAAAVARGAVAPVPDVS